LGLIAAAGGLAAWLSWSALGSEPDPAKTLPLEPSSSDPGDPGAPEPLPEPAVELESGQASTSREELAPAPGDPPPFGDGTASPEGAIAVSVVGLQPGAQALVAASHWRDHPGAEAEIAAELLLPPGEARGLLFVGPGAYAVQARSGAWTSGVERAEVVEGEPAVEVELALVACARVRGNVLGARGDGVPDLEVHALDADDQVVSTTLTGFAGGFELACVPAGDWSLVVGAIDGPLLPPRRIAVGPDGCPPQELVLPSLGAFEVVVRDEAGAVVPELDLDAIGGDGGRLELRTDFGGRAASELALPGTWRVFADAGELGRGNAVFEVAEGERARAELVLRRRPVDPESVRRPR
jgi:hypothetical protein